MLTMVKLLVLALSVTVSLARPQEDVEAVTSLEALLEDTSLEAGEMVADQGKLLGNNDKNLKISNFQMDFCW